MTASVKQLPELKKRKLSLRQRNFPHFSSGEQAEHQAQQYLRNRGYTIRATNLVFQKYEVDIVAISPDQKTLVIAEVKFRQSRYSGNPSQAVSRQKILKMNRVATALIRKYCWQKQYQFDIIAITPGSLEHFRNVSW